MGDETQLPNLPPIQPRPRMERDRPDSSVKAHDTGYNNKFDLNNKIMLTAIISLSAVVVVVTILHIYARYVIRRQARRRAAIRQLALAVSELHNIGEPPKTGLDQAVIASLPIFVFKQSDADDETEAPECAVCLSILEDDEMARLLPNCKHTFHAECIDKWLSSQSTCPICRTGAEPVLVPEAVAAGGAPPTAQPVEPVNCTLTSMEGTSNGGLQSSCAKVSESSFSRLSSFRRMLSRERSARQIQSQSCGHEDGPEDLERQ